MSVEQKLFKRSKIKELRKIKSSEPRKFWKFLNGIKNSSAEVTLESCFEYFRTMNASQNQENIPEANFPENEYNLETNAEINGPILWSEIEKAVCSLKNNKAGGLDMIVNEHIKNCYKLPNMRIILLKLFNIVFDSGYVPTSWSTGNIIPIYKQKGDQTDPSNYRPITLLSCLGKLFTRILNDRLQQYSDKYDKISQNQAGFRKRFSTTDHIFALHMLINLVQNRRNKLFCAFIDLKRAFDTVWRDGLFHKMKLFNINGKCYNVVKNMYNNIKSCVTVNGNSSPLFACNIGVRQGENLSPLLFSIFLNDLEDHLSRSGNIDGISIASNNINENAYFFLKIFVLLYADDTVILAESDEDLQHALNAYATYCENWKLSVNTDKTKIMIFSKGRQLNYNFVLNNKNLEIVSEFKYLGIVFSRSGSFLAAKKHIAAQASRAMFCLLKKARSLLLPVDIQIEMFEKTVKPILLYGCEVTGLSNIDILEQVQLKFLKHILNLKKSTPNCMVYGETGVMPLRIDAQCRVISYWSKLVCPVTNNLSSKLYAIALSLYNNGGRNQFKWLKYVKNVLISCGFSGIWDTHMYPNRTWLIKATKQKLTDLFLNEWHSQLDNNSSCHNYKIFKTKFGFEHYLVSIEEKYKKYLVKFRTRNHRLPIETGRWRRIPRHNRTCHLCHTDVGDEYHYLMSCSHFSNLRKLYIDRQYFLRPNVIKFSNLLNIKHPAKLRKLCTFIKNIIESI